MLELPRPGQDVDAARQEMLEVIDDPITTVLIARGDDEDTRRFAERADGVARLSERVIYLTNPQVLTPAQEASWFADDAGDPVIGAVLNDRNGRCARVLRKRQTRINIRIAFAQCGAQS